MSCTEAATTMIDGLAIDASKTEVPLGITIDHQLKFDDHINYLCKITDQKLNVLARIAPFMNVSKERIYQIALWVLSSKMDVPNKSIKRLCFWG